MSDYNALHKNSQSADLMEVDELEALMGKLVTEWNKLVKMYKEMPTIGRALKGVRP